jgi:hypothetical protein
MKANSKKSVSTVYVPSKAYQKYAKSASSFWSSDDFDTTFKVGSHLDFTKLAATQRAIGNFVNIVTGKQIPVTFQSNDSSYTDGTSVVIGTKLEGNNFDPAVGLALHEGSHIAYTDFGLFKTPTGNQAISMSATKFASIIRAHFTIDHISDKHLGIIKDLLNWIEDRRIDYKIYTSAPGYRMYYEAMYNKYFNDKVIDVALVTGEKCSETWDDYMFHIINFTNPNRQLNALKSLKTVWDLIDLKNIDRLSDTKAALTLAIEVYSVLKEACTPAEMEDIQEMLNEQLQSGSGDGDGGAGDGGDGFSGPAWVLLDDGSNGSSDTEEPVPFKSKMSDKDLKKLEDMIQQQKDFINGSQKKVGKLTKTQSALVRALKESGTETRIVKTNPHSTAGTIGDVTTVVIKKMNPQIICSMPGIFDRGAADYMQKLSAGVSKVDGYQYANIRNTEAAVNHGIILGKQLGNKLQLRNSDRSLKSTRLQTGKIDRRLISQLGYGNVNVFHKIVTDKYKNYFIHISIDASGSMHGDKMHQAIKSAVAIAQAASMTTGIRVQISLRGTDNVSGNTEKCVTVYAYDSAYDKMIKIKTLFKYLNVFGCTPEGIAFKSIEADIKADAKGDELIFINYSDGQPSPVAGMHSATTPLEFTRKTVSNMRSYGFNIISYFIFDRGYSYSYDDDRRAFIKMYGEDSIFINPVNMIDVSKSINKKFLEIAK